MKPPCLFTVREAILEDAVEIARVHVQSWKESYKGIIEQTYLDSISFEQRLEQRKCILAERPEHEKNLVACNERGEIVGFCDIGDTRSEALMGAGEVYAIYILKKYQRKGIGSALWKHSTNHFLTCGLTPFNVLVLEQNWPARLFYEKRRGSIAHVQTITLGRNSYKKICYFFRNIYN